MTFKNSLLSRLVELLPNRGPSLWILVVLLVVAFSLGMIISGGGNSSPSTVANTAGKTDQPTLWTCSMHPQIKLPEPGKCPICFMDLIPLAVASADELGPRQLKMSEAAIQLARIQTSPVKRAFADVEVRLVGKVTYDETRVANITAWVPGRLDSLYADFTGIAVRRGDPMVKMYSPELLSAQEELIQAKKAVENLTDRPGTIMKTTSVQALSATREKLRLLGLTDNQVAEIEAQENPSDYLTIYAPIGGVVVQKNVTEGTYVNTGTSIYLIADLSAVWVMFDAFESDIGWLATGQKVQFDVDAYPGEKFTGTISFIDPVLNEMTRTVGIRVLADNREGKLKPGMFATGFAFSRIDKNGVLAISGQTNKAAAPLLIPSTAPLITGKRAVVYVQVTGEDGAIFEGRQIELGPLSGDFYVVKSGLAEGDLVVTNGAFKIDSELQIQAKPSMMTPQGGGILAHQHGNMGNMADEPAVEKVGTEEKSPAVNRKAEAALSPLYDSYFQLQMALADDSLAVAQTAFRKLKDAAAGVNMGLFKGETHKQWMDIAGDIKSYGDEGVQADNIDAARQIFMSLSKTIIAMHENFGHAGKDDFYLTFCPMYNENKGAYWLQDVDTVYNPFYGHAMLRCGSIKSPLPPQ